MVPLTTGELHFWQLIGSVVVHEVRLRISGKPAPVDIGEADELFGWKAIYLCDTVGGSRVFDYGARDPDT